MSGYLNIKMKKIDTKSPSSDIYDGHLILFKEMLLMLSQSSAVPQEVIEKGMKQCNDNVGSVDQFRLFEIICDQKYAGQSLTELYRQCCLRLFQYASRIQKANSFTQVRLDEDGDLYIDGWYFQPFEILSSYRSEQQESRRRRRGQN